MTGIGNYPPGYRAAICRYCGSAFHEVPTGYGVCDTCDIRNMFSDAWKDAHGMRPRFAVSVKQARSRLADGSL